MELLNIPPDVWQGGAVGLLGVTFLLVMFGYLVPRSFYRQVVKERDYWRDAAMKQQAHTEALLPAARMNVEFVRGMQTVLGVPQPSEIGSRHGEPGGEDAA